jgi:hypothetical protein
MFHFFGFDLEDKSEKKLKLKFKLFNLLLILVSRQYIPVYLKPGVGTI